MNLSDIGKAIMQDSLDAAERKAHRENERRGPFNLVVDRLEREIRLRDKIIQSEDTPFETKMYHLGRRGACADLRDDIYEILGG